MADRRTPWRAILSFRLAYRRVKAHWGRLALSVVAVALGVALVVAIQLMNTAVLTAFLDTIDGMAGRAAFSIRAGEGLPFDETVLESLKDVPGVKLAVPLVTAVAFPDDGSGELLTVQGLDITNDDVVRVYHRGDKEGIVDDELTFLNSKTSVIVTNEFAKQRGLEVGSQLPLVTPTGVQTFTVRGLLEPEGLAKTLGGRLVVMDLLAAEEAFTQRGRINQIDLLVEPGQDAAVKATVTERLPPGLLLEEPALRKDIVRRTVRGLQGLLTAFAFLAVVAGFVVCYGRLAAVFEARTWETGLLRAVGLGRAAVFIELLKESLLLGLAGAALGIPLGIAIGRIGLPAVATTAALQFRLPIPVARPVLAWAAVAMGLVVGVVAAVLAAAVPALRLARTRPIAALALRGRDAPATGGRLRLAISGCLLAAVLMLIVVQVHTGLTVLGTFTTSLLALGACLGARPLVEAGSRGLHYVWAWCFGSIGRFAAAHLRQHARRTALTVATLGVGLGVVGMFGILAKSLEETVSSQLAAKLRADLIVTSANVSGGWVNSPVDEVVADRLRAIEGVSSVAAQALHDLRYRGAEAGVDGYDRECFNDHRLCGWDLLPGALPDALTTVSDGTGAIVSASFARQFDVAPGDSIDLDSPRGPQRFDVVAISRTEPRTTAIVSRDRYRNAWNDRNATWIHISVSPAVAPSLVAARIAESLGSQYRLQIRNGPEMVAYFAQQVRSAFGFLYLMEAVTFVLVLIGIGDTLATGVLERTREIGMMRAIGFSRSGVFLLVLLEGFAIGVLGLVLAVGTATSLGAFWVMLQFPSLMGWSLEAHLPTSFLTTVAVSTLALCAIGSLLPSLRASRLKIAVALRAD